ncbi:uncharacterized protein LOC126819197 isoform X2 [Patella vulgata]|uniref:uncharacterized protein LOC126819197 isoform X2 n=1 Tax=Patella vulgata TaxID=6465 RepID=UPI00217F80B3|nr:uncharacterized protein LOC126819197 isoform X2 [Patella vulgata]
MDSHPDNYFDLNFGNYSSYLIGRSCNLNVDKSSSEVKDYSNKENSQKLKSSLINIPMVSAGDLPHPKSLRKRLSNRTPKYKNVKVKHDQAMMVENHIKQMKFRIARVNRNEDFVVLNNECNSDVFSNDLCLLNTNDLPPLPPIKTPLHEHRSSYPASYITPPQINYRTVSRTNTNKLPALGLGINERYSIMDFYNLEPISSLHDTNTIPIPSMYSYSTTNLRRHSETPTDFSPDQGYTRDNDNEEAWLYQQWKPRCIFPSYEE